MDFAKLVLDRLRELGINVNQAELRAGLPQGYIRGVVREDGKRAVPNIEKAATIAKALGLELYLGPPIDHGSPGPDVSDDFAKIALTAATVAAGNGQSAIGEETVEELAFQRSWLKRLGVSPSSAVLTRVTGDSMFPTICNGDIVLVDTSAKQLPVKRRSPKDKRPSPIYALRDGGGARIKRIERPQENLVILISDNPHHPPEILEDAKTAEMAIIGRVVWWGHTNRD